MVGDEDRSAGTGDIRRQPHHGWHRSDQQSYWRPVARWHCRARGGPAAAAVLQVGHTHARRRISGPVRVGTSPRCVPADHHAGVVEAGDAIERQAATLPAVRIDRLIEDEIDVEVLRQIVNDPRVPEGWRRTAVRALATASGPLRTTSLGAIDAFPAPVSRPCSRLGRDGSGAPVSRPNRWGSSTGRG